MNCSAANRLYVRADGHVPCNCDVGENIRLFTPVRERPESYDYVSDCYNGPPFKRIREMFKRGELYHPACKDCYFFRPDEEFLHYGDGGTLKKIENLQIESSFLCSIDCEACVKKSIRMVPELSPLGAGPYNFPPESFRKLVDDLERHEIEVQEFFFCGRGEPLMHPRFGELIAYARSRFPTSTYTSHTNGNLNFFPEILDLDYIIISVDGARQESYEQYRRGGKIDLAFKLMQDLAGYKRAARSEKLPAEIASQISRKNWDTFPIIQWKYILFEHNDSTEEIREAQQLAADFGIDEMAFVLSHTWNRSRKYVSMDMVSNDPLFHEFARLAGGTGRKVVFHTMVNDDVNNVELWKDRVGSGQKARESSKAVEASA